MKRFFQGWTMMAVTYKKLFHMLIDWNMTPAQLGLRDAVQKQQEYQDGHLE